jgi:hypothetical protein
MQQHEDGLTRRLSAIGIPKYTIKPFIDLMVKWERCSGVEWTIKRLKSLKVALIQRRAGLNNHDIWIRKNRNGDYSGTVGSLFRWANVNEDHFSRTVQAFMAYTYYILPSLSEAQKEKFLGAINPPKGDGLDDDFHKSFSRTVRLNIRKRIVVQKPQPLVIYRGSPDKKAPSHFGRKSVPQSEGILNELQIFNTTSGIRLYQDFHRLYQPLLVGIGQRKVYLDYLVSNGSRSSDYVANGGEIHFLQEPGGKLRSIASPFRIHQEALRPLGDELYRLVQSLPWDCTFDQTKAIPHIQSHLAKGGQVHSIDLSNATDHFPLSIQETALRAVLRKDSWDHIDLFVKISRGEWRSELGTLKWTKGQPLGLYPSFASFTLTHGLLLLHLAGSFNNQFFVVGDDVVILDVELRNRYISMLDRMACPWSVDKSIDSSKLSEFAGKIITSERVIPQLKWRNMSNDNFLDICRLLGKRAYCLLNKRQKRVYDHVAHLCDPIGLNQSLPGDNLVTMIKRTLDFYSPEKVILGSLMGLRSRIHKVMYSTDEDLNSDELREISSTFDEKVKSVVLQTIFSNWEVLLSVGLESISEIPQALGLVPRLPYREMQPSRVTTLDRYERLLTQNARA